jgi:hypothetical protein
MSRTAAHTFHPLPQQQLYGAVQQQMRYSPERSGGSIRLSSITLIHKHLKEDTSKDHACVNSLSVH